jgi:murein DD-endopeptidase MepM/ murein hydrolase activator NlpD
MKRQQEPSSAKAFTHRQRLSRVLIAVILISLPAAARAQKEAVSCGCSGFVQPDGKTSALKMLLDTATRISSAFGPRISPIFGTPEMHTGIDIAAPAGTPIHAAADGIISIAWLCGGYGNYVRIRHGNDTATGYAHASKFARGIYSGAHVAAGQIIAYVGSTGLSTGPHLHFEVLVKGQPVRPACACMLTGP